MLKKAHFKNFTAFDDLRIVFSPGINVFIGENSTGKTHAMKILYAACDVIRNDSTNFAQKINDVFYPSGKQIGRLVKRENVSNIGKLDIMRSIEKGRDVTLSLALSNHTISPDKCKISGAKDWRQRGEQCAYIPVKDMMANAPGFSSLYQSREIYFEEIYNDILQRASLPRLKGKKSAQHQTILDTISAAMSGTVVENNQEFFLKCEQGNLEFTLLAEGIRKLGLLWVLIQNGTLLSGSVLFWDEPEANLNPSVIPMVADILMELQRQGTQIFIATHGYLLAKYLEIKSREEDNVSFFSFYKDANDPKHKIQCEQCRTFRDLKNNPIIKTYEQLLNEVYDFEIGN